MIRAGVALELSQVALDLPVETWKKPAGVAATGRIDDTRTPAGAYDVSLFAIEALHLRHEPIV